MTDERMNRDGAANYIGSRRGWPMSADALAKLAERGTGPAFKIMFGQASYTKTGIDAWLDGLIAAAPSKRAYRAKTGPRIRKPKT